MREKISVIVPVYNERDSLPELARSLRHALDCSGEDYEVVFIDDGSTDGSSRFLEDLANANPLYKLIQFRRNFGQTAAMSAGFKYARGELLVSADADLQNDPADIPAVLAKLREGYDVVSCWRQDRKDSWLARRLPSYLANRLISWISGVNLHDYGCTLKGYRKAVVEHIRLYGEMHRFIPIYADSIGASVAELPVRHHARLQGESKYGVNRGYKVILDMLTVKLLVSYSTKPMYFFGGAGLWACSGGALLGLWTLADKFLHSEKAYRNELLLLAVFLFLLGIQFILMGIVAELVIRTYFEAQQKETYVVQRTWNCDEGGSA